MTTVPWVVSFAGRSPAPHPESLTLGHLHLAEAQAFTEFHLV